MHGEIFHFCCFKINFLLSLSLKPFYPQACSDLSKNYSLCKALYLFIYVSALQSSISLPIYLSTSVYMCAKGSINHPFIYRLY